MFKFFERITNLTGKETAHLESEQTRNLKILRVFCWIFITLCGITLVSDLIQTLVGMVIDLYSVLPVFLLFIATLISYGLARSGQYKASSRLLVISCTIVLLLIYYFFGTDIPLLTFLLLPIVLTIVLLDTLAVVLVTSLCVIASLILIAIQNLWGIYTPVAGVRVPESGVIFSDVFILLLLFPALITLILIPTRVQANILRRQNQQLLEALRQVEARQQTSQVVSQQVRVLAAELMDSAAQQAGGSQQQAAVVTQVDVSLNELSVAASSIAQMAVQANHALDNVAQDSQHIEKTTNLSVQQSEEGLLAVRQTLTVSREVAGLYQEFLQMTDTLKQRNANMRQILQIISSIASETHLLSLNAAIEAAGAGQYGERFNVVAQEVKNLAARSSAASHEVVQIIEQIEEAGQSAALIASSGYRKAQEMERVVEQAGAVIGHMGQVCEQAHAQASSISQSTRQVKELTGVIQVATNQQHSASRQVLNALSGLRTVAEENASGSQVVSSTAINLEEMSRNLNLALAN